MLNEEALSAWLQLSNTIDNQRVIDALPYNEALVCGLLAGGCRTASDLCAETRILKSQMTGILKSLEAKGILHRQRSRQDRRRVELQLLPEGAARYADGHRQALEVVDRVIEVMGEENVRALVPLLRQATEAFDAIRRRQEA